jgi:hypothetical protein
MYLGKRNVNAPKLCRLLGCNDPVFPYQSTCSSNARLALFFSLENFNLLVSLRLDNSTRARFSYLQKYQVQMYGAILDPEKILYRELTSGETSENIMMDRSDDGRQLYLCKKYVTKLNGSISNFKDMVVFQACCNYLNHIPSAVGLLKNLKILILSKNRLRSLPYEIGGCSDLREIDVSFNSLTSLPTSVVALKSLHTLHLERNLFRVLPSSIGKLNSLKYLNVRNNPISFVPFEIFKLPFLLNLLSEGCGFLMTNQAVCRTIGRMTLMETISRRMVRNNLFVLKSMPSNFRKYLLDVRECSFCGGPYFKHYVEIEDYHLFEGEMYPVKYRMCSQHYTDHKSRISALFQSGIDTHPARLLRDTSLSVSEIFEPYCYRDQKTEENDKKETGRVLSVGRLWRGLEQQHRCMVEDIMDGSMIQEWMPELDARDDAKSKHRPWHTT